MVFEWPGEGGGVCESQSLRIIVVDDPATFTDPSGCAEGSSPVSGCISVACAPLYVPFMFRVYVTHVSGDCEADVEAADALEPHMLYIGGRNWQTTIPFGINGYAFVAMSCGKGNSLTEWWVRVVTNCANEVIEGTLTETSPGVWTLYVPDVPVRLPGSTCACTTTMLNPGQRPVCIAEDGCRLFGQGADPLACRRQVRKSIKSHCRLVGMTRVRI